MENDKKINNNNKIAENRAAQVFHNFHFSFNKENLQENGMKLQILT